MTSYKTYLTVDESNQIIVSNLPFKPGQKVEVRIEVVDENKQPLVKELQNLFKEIQALPSSKNITEEEIVAEIEAYRQQNQ
jgi:flagellar biosynthesis/type III secretory pathway chaperone